MRARGVLVAAALAVAGLAACTPSTPEAVLEAARDPQIARLSDDDEGRARPVLQADAPPARVAPEGANAVSDSLPAAMQPGAPDAPLTDPLTCLARTVYFESRGRPEREQIAVAWVVLNRAEDPRYPDRICGVVRDGGPERPCQFSWWCDGRSDVARHEGEYSEALSVARKVLAGEAADPTDGANMFHLRSIRPYWTRAAKLKGKIGAHWFWHL